jgi:hypothetical protein
LRAEGEIEVNAEQHNKQSLILGGAIVATMIIVAAVLGIVPHPWNLTPIGAMALFSGAMFRNRCIAFAWPLASLFAGHLLVGFHKLIFVVYVSFAISVAIGRWLGDARSVARIGGAVFMGAAQFFVVTNFAVWAIGGFIREHSKAC